MHKFLATIIVLLLVGVVSAATTARHKFNYSGNADQDRNTSLLDRRVPYTQDGKVVVPIYFCGQLANGTDYLSAGAAGTPIIMNLLSLGSTACDGEDSGTETTADEVLYNGALRVLSMCCEVSSSGSNGVTLTARSAAADLSPTLTLTIPTGTTSKCVAPTTIGNVATVAAGATGCVKAVTTEDLATADALCVWLVELQ